MTVVRVAAPRVLVTAAESSGAAAAAIGGAGAATAATATAVALLFFPMVFPMVPNPQSLIVSWSSESDGGNSVLPLDFLQGLHVKGAQAKR
jgi:hypothetical protein